MKCPKCESEQLSSTVINEIEVDRCGKCQGVWFDERELPQLLDTGRASLRPIRGGKLQEELNRKKARCPRDGSELTRVCSATKAEIIVDSCPQCHGVWCDGGELDQLLK